MTGAGEAAETGGGPADADEAAGRPGTGGTAVPPGDMPPGDMPAGAGPGGTATAGTAGTSGEALGWELSTAVVSFHEAIARRLGLNAIEHKALGMIVRAGPLPVGALAPRLGVGASAVTGIVDRLERAGYVRRGPDPADRRRVLVAAVPSRVPDLTGVFAELGRQMAAFMARYDERELAVILDYVQNTIRVLQELTARLTEEQESAQARRRR